MFLQFLRLDGKAFHTVGPAWKNARSPKVFRVTLGITSNVSESGRRLYLVLGLTTSSSDKYCGARPFNVLKTESAILNSSLNFTGNQWSPLSTGVIWTNLGIKHVTQAAALRTFWSRSYWYCGGLYKRALQQSKCDVANAWIKQLCWFWRQIFPNLPNIIKPPKCLTTHLSYMSIHRHMVIKPCAKISNMLKGLNVTVTNFNWSHGNLRQLLRRADD